MTLVKAVIFDLGRVLVHYDHQAMLAAVAAVSRMTTADLHALLIEVEENLGLGHWSTADLHRFLIEQAGTTTDEDQFLQAYAAGIGRDEAALAYALALQTRPNTTVGVISNTNEAHVQWLDDAVPELKAFDLVMMSNEVGLLKPDPAIFTLALELLGVEAAQAIFVDDNAANGAAAQALGITAILHTDWAVTRPQVEAWLGQ